MISSPAERMQKLRHKRKQLGKCTRCGRDRDGSFSTCEKCRSEYRSYHRLDEEGRDIKSVRSLRVWQITNPKLYEKLEANKLTVNQFANITGVSIRTAERWIFEETEPVISNKLKINQIFAEEIYEV